MPVEIFFSYAHEDEALMDRVRRQLVVNERNGRILKWHDRQIPAGSEWRHQIDQRLQSARIILLFVSPDFLDSNYCYEVEGKEALRRHKAGEARVIPVILRPCLFDDAPFSELQALPTDAKPISTWADVDNATLDVARGIMKVVVELEKGEKVEGSDKGRSRAAAGDDATVSALGSRPPSDKIAQAKPDTDSGMSPELKLTGHRTLLPPPMPRFRPTPRPNVLTNPLRFEWQRDIQGLHISVTNLTGEVLRHFELTITDLHWWAQDVSTFVQVSEYHRGAFRPIKLTGDCELFHDTPVVFPFLHLENDRLVFLGSTESAAVRMNISKLGVWRVNLRYQWANPEMPYIPSVWTSTIGDNEYVYFEWLGEGTAPTECSDSSICKRHP